MPYLFNSFKEEGKKVKEWLTRELASVRTGRATPALLDGIQVESYGARVPLKQLGSIGVDDPRTLKITLWDKGQMRGVELAIQAANLGVSVRADADAMRVIFPELTADKRQILLKLTKEKLEEARIRIRKERERVWNDLQAKEKAGQLSEDEKFRLKDELQKQVEELNREIEATGERKAAEIEQ